MAACIMLAATIGCGEGEGVAEGATVTVYVSAPLSGERAAEGRKICAGARRELARNGSRAGNVRVRVVCLDDTGGARRWTLAAVGANAHRATEDSTTIGYIGDPDPIATRFSKPILEEADIPQLSGLSGSVAMAKLLRTVDEAGDSGSLRQSVFDELR